MRIHAWVLIVLAAGCVDLEDDVATGTTPAAALDEEASWPFRNGQFLNGQFLNGQFLNGQFLNGQFLNGQFLNGQFLNGTFLGGISVTNVVVDKGVLHGTRGGQAISGPAFVGATFPAVTDQDVVVNMRITEFTYLGSLGAYVVEYESDSRGEGSSTDVWNPMCGHDTAGRPVFAIPDVGTWDFRRDVIGAGGRVPNNGGVTFACVNGAIGKCLTWGYYPWASSNARFAHQACVRAVRSDFCGDGRSWTVDGTPINLYDSLGVNEDTAEWTLEGGWHSMGAEYIYAHRAAGAPVMEEFLDYLNERPAKNAAQRACQEKVRIRWDVTYHEPPVGGYSCANAACIVTEADTLVGGELVF